MLKLNDFIGKLEEKGRAAFLRANDAHHEEALRPGADIGDSEQVLHAVTCTIIDAVKKCTVIVHKNWHAWQSNSALLHDLSQIIEESDELDTLLAVLQSLASNASPADRPSSATAEPTRFMMPAFAAAPTHREQQSTAYQVSALYELVLHIDNPTAVEIAAHTIVEEVAPEQKIMTLETVLQLAMHAAEGNDSAEEQLRLMHQEAYPAAPAVIPWTDTPAGQAYMSSNDFFTPPPPGSSPPSYTP